tara:strand:+ start:12149 stop:13129 length:981 start_codon:yes stop_codon:yes gene_type:complete
MSHNYKISIIIPIYKVEDYIDTCIKSVINQTYKNLEIILVDDESPDNCGLICDKYAIIDSRIKVIHQKNKGLSGARNSGLKIATGDFIGFVDSDDWIEPDMYKTMLEIAIINNLKIVECGVSERKNENAPILIPNKTKVSLLIEDYISAYKRIIRETKFSVWRRLYKKEIIANYSFKEGKISEDVYFTIDNLKNTDRLGYFNFPFYNYRLNPDSITRSAYTTKDFDALDAAIYLNNSIIKNFQSEKELLLLSQTHLLKRLFRHYRLLNINHEVDHDFKHRKETKELINKHYHNKVGTKIKLAKYLNIYIFFLVIKLNQLKLNIFNR